MTIVEAFASGKPLTREGKQFHYMSGWAEHTTYIMPETFIDPQFFLSVIKLTTEDIIATDWKIKLDK